MGKLVEPKVYFIGATAIIDDGMEEYLRDSGNEDFANSIVEGRKTGFNDGEIISSFYAKLCYASLTVGKNLNISRTRDIQGNIKGCFDQGHGSVFEHCMLNFVIRNCSRVFTHELVRHRVGTAFSQTSGRFVRTDEIDIVMDPILLQWGSHIKDFQSLIEEKYRELVKAVGVDKIQDQYTKKKITSALRRLLPNGQSNEMGFSVNLRSIRHLMQLRTSRHAEWEIRYVFNQIYNLLNAKYPLLFYGASISYVDGLLEITGMRSQPYDPVSNNTVG